MKKTSLQSRFLSLVLCVCMVLSLLPMMPLVAEAATVPTYISGIAVAYGSSASTPKNILRDAGYTVINYDLNEDAGGRYVYMGYKTTTDPSKAITGIFFSSTGDDSHPNSKTFDGVTAYLLGGSTEANPGENTYVDLNKGAGGNYIYTYVTRDTSRAPIIAGMYFNTSSSASGYVTPGTNLNAGTGDQAIYLHYQQFSGKASSTFYYLTSGGSRTSSTTSVSVKNHTQSVSTTPSVPSTVTYDGRTFTFRGWREDNTATSSTVSPSYTYMDSKVYRAVYSATVTLSYNANGGSGAPSSQTATQYINAGSSSVSKTSHSFTIPTTKPTHDDSKCVFLGWSTRSSATSASYQPGYTISISSNTTLYAVWRGEHTANRTYVNNGADHTYTWPCCGKSVTEAHSYTDGLCVCGAINPDAVATVSKNGVITGAYATLNDAILAVEGCTAADAAVLKLLKDIPLGNSYQTISSGVFTIDLNGKTLSGTSRYGVLDIHGAADVTVTDFGTGGTISGYSEGIFLSSDAKLTITGGIISGSRGISASGGATLTISGGSINGSQYGVYSRENSTVTISGGTISGSTSGISTTDEVTLTISGGTITGGTHRGISATARCIINISGGSISGGKNGVYANGGTVNISGGSISGSEYGVNIIASGTLTISGGSISGEWVDIRSYSDSISRYNIITLTLGENGMGATFPGGIEVGGTTLNDILGEGAAYWQGNTMILPANGATEISGGDVTIKASCPHTAAKSNYTDLKDGAKHTYVCSGCNNTFTEAHSYDEATLRCVCGAVSPDAVATVSKNGVVTGAYTTLNDAIQAVADCTADDKAVVTILKKIELGSNYQTISSGVFTIDLNGFEISSTRSNYGALRIMNAAANVTVQDSGEDGKITGVYAGIEVWYGRLTVLDGTISGEKYGVHATDSTVTVSGGTISGNSYGVYAHNSTVTISGGSISGGTNYGLFAFSSSTVTITGGSITGDRYDLYNYISTITLPLGEDGVGATFPGGIAVYGTTLNEILGAGAAYWQGNNMILPADDATEITGGDVVIKSICPHTASKSNYVDLEDGASHTCVCSGCNNIIIEAHSYTNGLCVCGAVSPDAVASLSKNGKVVGAYTTLNDAVQAVKNCTAADQAVVTLLKTIDLGDSYQSIFSGVFTIDLNGFEISSTKSYYGVLCIDKAAANVTIQDSGEDGKITGVYAGIEMRGGTLTVLGGTVSGSRYGVYADNSTVTISGGTVSGGYYGVDASSSTVTISGGTVSSDYYGVDAYASTVTISGGTVSGNSVGVYAYDSTVTVSGGTISGDDGVYVYDSTVTVSGGTISGGYYGVYANNNSTVTVSSGTVSGSYYGVYANNNSTVTVSGGSISGGNYDIFNSSSTITLTLGEDGVGATFPGGIKVYRTTLNEILGEDAAYWQGDKQINPADDATEISGGDVVIKAYVAPSGWTEINGNWYYYDPDTNTPVTGIVRVPYPAETINGVTYAPDQESIDYAASKGQTFIDETTGLFWFDADGKFLSSYTGIIPSEDGPSQYAVNGHIAWHVGLVQVGEDYYYFNGNSEIGGNKMATGDIYANRNNTDFDMVAGGVYTFGADGKLCKYDGIVDLRYYENYRLMIGNGLTKVGDNYIYVDRNGDLVADAEYYIPGNDLGIASGMYAFDENGFMIQPVSTDKNGVYFENGAWYYYENGKIGYNKGMISVSTTWYGEDGTENVYSGYIYVRSSGKLATGEYYITNVSNDASGLFTLGMKVIFDENGIADAPKSGIYEVGGELYYFVNNQIQYNAGLIEYNGGWIYVRSSGKLATGAYWITNTNGNLEAGMYEFGADGYLVISDVEDGIVNEDGVLYYYLDGKKQYGIGLVQLEDGSYIYVRTNGELATGSYWITNHNGLLPEGMYTFGEDGLLTVN